MTQQINISDETYNAIAAQYGDVAAFLEQVAIEQLNAETTLGDDELAASLAMIDQSVAEFDAGGGLSIEAAQQRTHERFQQFTK